MRPTDSHQTPEGGTHSPTRVLVVIPTHNEVANIAPLIAGIRQQAPLVELLFVDDQSTDGTRAAIAQAQAQQPGRIHLLPRPGKLGLGTAYVAGFKWALARDFTAVVQMDADLSHRPEDLARILEVLRDRPVVVGSRYLDGGGTQNWSLLRQAISRLGSTYARLILGLDVRDMTGGFNGWQRQVLEAIGPDSLTSEGYAFQVELKFRAHLLGFPLTELPILFVERRAGQSKMSSAIVWEAMARVARLSRLRRQLNNQIAGAGESGDRQRH